MSITTTSSAEARSKAGAARIVGLQCRECGQLYPAEARHVCDQCFGPVEVAYDYELIRSSISRQAIANGPRTLWRYKPLLPIEGERVVDSHAGFTPLIQAHNLGKALGLKALWIK